MTRNKLVVLDAASLLSLSTAGDARQVADPAGYTQFMQPRFYMDPNTCLAMPGSQTCDPENPNANPGWSANGC